MPKGKEIVNINVDRISLVGKAANRRKFVMLKANKEGETMTLIEMVKAGIMTQEDVDFLQKATPEGGSESAVITQMKGLITSLATTLVKQKEDGAEIKDELMKAVKEQITASIEAIKKEESDAKAAADKAEADKVEADKVAADAAAAAAPAEGSDEAKAKEELEKNVARIGAIQKAESMDEMIKIIKEMRGETVSSDLDVVETLTKKITELEERVLKMKKTSDQIEPGAETKKKAAKEVTFAGMFS